MGSDHSYLNNINKLATLFGSFPAYNRHFQWQK